MTDDALVEKVARALFIADPYWGGDSPSWESMEGVCRDKYLDFARAAIRAMREAE